MRPNSSRPPQLVLFDIDDTVFDHTLTCRAALAVVRRETEELQSRTVDELTDRYLGLLDLQPPDVSAPPSVYARWRAERFRRLGDICGSSIAPDRAAEISTRYRAHYQRLRRPVPGAVPFVRSIARSARVGMLTNNELREQEEKLRFLGLRDVVDPLVVSAEERVAKPDPRIYRIALSRAGVDPSATVMVGDSWANDVLGPRAVGIRAVWFNRFGRSPPTRHRVPQIRSFRPRAPATEEVLGAVRTGGPGPSERRERRESCAL